MLRAGLEVKPVSKLAVRAGYGLTTSPEQFDIWGEKLPLLYTQNASFGLGYSSDGSFFADIACRYALLQTNISCLTMTTSSTQTDI